MAKLSIKQTKSRIGATEKQCRNLDALGLRKIGQVVEHDDSAIIRGMVTKVRHMVVVEVK
ncbi:MAG: 50S ribosomal protein L30 [Rikenellaceae bacterium]